MNHKMRRFAAIAAGTQSPQFLPHLPIKILSKMRDMRAEHTAIAHIWGPKTVLKREKELVLIRLCAPFVAQSAGGV